VTEPVEPPTDADPDSEAERQRHAELVSMVAFSVSVAGSLLLAIVYWRGGQPQLEGLGLLAALGGLGTALVIWGRHLLDEGTFLQDRHPLSSTDEERQEFETSLERDEMVTRRRALRGFLLASLGMLGAALVFPLRSLGPSPGQSLDASPWHKGVRLVDEQNRPILARDVPLNGLVTAFPNGQPDSAQGQIALVRVRPSSIRSSKSRAGWSPGGMLAYSKVCTHAGCPVSLYLADSHELLCPCHQSAFDALEEARPVQGPAARALPQLPLAVDQQGYVTAAGDFSAPVGPAWWGRS
jgi:ubiquinol-cytochrome c reductase iron-sulfur subunit